MIRITPKPQPIRAATVRRPVFGLLSDPALVTYRAGDYQTKLTLVNATGTMTDYTRMRALVTGTSTIWMRHPAAYPALRYKAGGDAVYATDDQNALAVWNFTKAGGTRTATVNDNGTVVANATRTYTGLAAATLLPTNNDKPPTECTQQHLGGLSLDAAAMGTHSRLINIGWLSGGNPVGHVPFEYWDRQLRRWVAVDATYGILGMRHGGELLGWAEIAALAFAGRAGEIQVEKIPGYGTGIADLQFTPTLVQAIAVRWYSATLTSGLSLGLPKGGAVVGCRAGQYNAVFNHVNAQQNWPECSGLSDLTYSVYTINFLRAERVTGGIAVQMMHSVPNFARYEYRAVGSTDWVPITGDTAIVPVGAQVRGIDDFENATPAYTLEVV